MKDTGERIIPKLMKPTNGMLLEHVARYFFAFPYMNGRVLDLACGTGYGCHMIAKNCKYETTEIVGVDIDPEVIDYAKREYYHQRVEYQVGDATREEIVAELGLFDTIVSFETLEHVEEDEKFLDHLYSMLKPGGKLVISSPFGRGRGMPTSEPFHIHQYTPEEFEGMFGRYSEVEFFYQRGPTFEKVKREGVRYFIGIAVCTK